MNNALILAPIVLPLMVAALQLLIGERRRRTVVALSVASCVALLGVSVALLLAASQQRSEVAMTVDALSWVAASSSSERARVSSVASRSDGVALR